MTRELQYIYDKISKFSLSTVEDKAISIDPDAFVKLYKDIYGYYPAVKEIKIDDVRVKTLYLP